jgi:hypothetical protein
MPVYRFRYRLQKTCLFGQLMCLEGMNGLYYSVNGAFVEGALWPAKTP